MRGPTEEATPAAQSAALAMEAIQARCREAARWLDEEVPPGTVPPQFLEGDPSHDELIAHCAALLHEVAGIALYPAGGERRQ